MSETKNAHDGVVTSIADPDLVMVVGPQGGLHPISFANLMKAVRGKIQIGGRNLALNSAQEKSGSYLVTNVNLSEPWENGKEYIMTFRGSIGEGKVPYFQIWDGRGSASMFVCSKKADGIYQGVFKPVNLNYTETERSTLRIYVQPSTVTSINTISKIKFERGNIATDYTPAPEDIASGLWGGVNYFASINYAILQKGGLRDECDKGTYKLHYKREGNRRFNVQRKVSGYGSMSFSRLLSRRIGCRQYSGRNLPIRNIDSKKSKLLDIAGIHATYLLDRQRLQDGQKNKKPVHLESVVCDKINLAPERRAAA